MRKFEDIWNDLHKHYLATTTVKDPELLKDYLRELGELINEIGDAGDFSTAMGGHIVGLEETTKGVRIVFDMELECIKQCPPEYAGLYLSKMVQLKREIISKLHIGPIRWVYAEKEDKGVKMK